MGLEWLQENLLEEEGGGETGAEVLGEGLWLPTPPPVTVQHTCEPRLQRASLGYKARPYLIVKTSVESTYSIRVTPRLCLLLRVEDERLCDLPQSGPEREMAWPPWALAVRSSLFGPFYAR